jgi:soluble cytochrome b562
MGKIIKLTEGDLIHLIKRVLAEETEMTEACWKGYTKKGMKTMFGKKYPNCVKNESEETNEASSPAQQAAIAINMKKKGIKPKNESLYEEEEESKAFDEHITTLDHIVNHFNRHTTEEELEFFISEIEYEVESAIRGEELSDDELDELIEYADFLVDELVSEFRLGADLNETWYKDRYGSVQSIDYNEEFINEAEYQGRKVQLGKIMQGDVKKFKVYVKNDKGKVVKVNFGFGGKSAKGKRMTIKKNNPARRKSFRARHNCENPGPRWKPRYWACRTW